MVQNTLMFWTVFTKPKKQVKTKRTRKVKNLNI